MITYRLVRDAMSPTEPTLGRLYAGDLDLYTEELPWLSNARDVSCIPCGTYRLVLAWSTRFNRIMPYIRDVPNRTGILIHGGATVADTKGCPLVGLQRNDDDVLLHGLDASALFQRELGGELKHDDVSIEVSCGS